jgi:TnpA family transposase
VLNGLLDNESELEIEEHYTDTHGQRQFAEFDWYRPRANCQKKEKRSR